MFVLLSVTPDLQKIHRIRKLSVNPDLKADRLDTSFSSARFKKPSTVSLAPTQPAGKNG